MLLYFMQSPSKNVVTSNIKEDAEDYFVKITLQQSVTAN